MMIISVLFVLLLWNVPDVFAQDRWTVPPKFHVPLSDVTVTSSATLVCPADDNQVFCSCRNMSDTDHVRWGDSTVTTTKGEQVRAGDSIEIRVRGAIYMISEGSDVSVSCTKEVQ